MQTTPKHRLRSYRDVVGPIRYRRPRTNLTLREASDQADSRTDLQYYLTALPKDASQNEKNKGEINLCNHQYTHQNADCAVTEKWSGTRDTDLESI